MTDSVFKGLDVDSLIATASAQAEGSQKAKFCADVAAAIGSNAIYEIYSGVTVALDAATLDGTVVYRTTISGALSSSGSGVVLPTQFTEPPTINTADALTGGNDVEVIRNASNSAIQIRTPIKVSGGTGFLTASKALDGTYTLRTSSRILKAPAVLDTNVGGGSTSGIYAVSTLISDMTSGNDSGWYIEAAPNTKDSNGPGGKYPYVAIGLNSSNGNSYWPGEYISDSAPLGISLTNSTNVYLLPWFVVGRAAQDTTGADNVRVQLRAHTLYGLKSDNTWDTISSDNSPITGASWHANFRSPGNETYENTSAGGGLAQIKSHSAGEGGGESIGSIGYGDDGFSIPRRYKWTVHGYNNGTTKTRSQWTAYKGLLYVIEARLIMHDPSGADNRSGAGLMMWMGADWYRYSPSDDYINENCHGRLKVITNDWAIYSCSDISSSLLTSYPPPGYS